MGEQYGSSPILSDATQSVSNKLSPNDSPKAMMCDGMPYFKILPSVAAIVFIDPANYFAGFAVQISILINVLNLWEMLSGLGRIM